MTADYAVLGRCDLDLDVPARAFDPREGEYRPILVYLFLVVLLRIFGKRELASSTRST